MGEVPLITPQGSFVINGAERVIVSQLHRSPGVAFEATRHPNGKMLHSFRVIPDRGSWFEAQFDTNDMLYVYLDRKKRRRKFLITTFLRAINFLEGADTSSDASLLNTFYKIEEVTTKKAAGMDDLESKVLISDLVEPEKGIVVARAFEPLSKAVVKRVSELGVKKIQIVDVSSDDGLIIRCMAKDPAHNEEEALKEINKRLRPGDPPTPANARALVKRLFFDPKRYDLGRVGRYKHQAYCYLLLDEKKHLSPTAAKRLRAIRETHHVPIPKEWPPVVNPDRLKRPVAVKKPTVARRYPRHRRQKKITIQECDWFGAGHGR